MALNKLVGRGFLLLRHGVAAALRPVLDREVPLAALADPWLELVVDEPRIAVELGWTGSVGPPCLLPGPDVTATLTGARLVETVRGGVHVSTAGEVPIPTMQCRTRMTFWFEPLAGWAELAEARVVVEDRGTRLEFTAQRPGAVGKLRIAQPVAGPIARGAWIVLAPTVEGHRPGQLRSVRFARPGASAVYHGPAGADVEYGEADVRFKAPPTWSGRGTLTIDAAMCSRVGEVRGARVLRARAAWMNPQVFVVEFAP